MTKSSRNRRKERRANGTALVNAILQGQANRLKKMDKAVIKGKGVLSYFDKETGKLYFNQELLANTLKERQ